jgi:hypothetical protein
MALLCSIREVVHNDGMTAIAIEPKAFHLRINFLDRTV